MKDKDGNILIPHFCEGIAPLDPLEKQAIADAPSTTTLSVRNSRSATWTVAAESCERAGGRL